MRMRWTGAVVASSMPAAFLTTSAILFVGVDEEKREWNSEADRDVLSR